MNIRERIRDLEAEKRELVVTSQGGDAAVPPDKMPVEVTCVMSVWNDWMNLPRVLFSLETGAQGTPMNLILVDNQSTDPSKAILAWPDLAKWLMRGRGFKDVQVLGPVPRVTQHSDGTPIRDPQQVRNVNLEFLKKKLTMQVQTEFILYQDSDVLMPTGGVRDLLDALKADKALALVGILYEQFADHVNTGCTMGRTEILQQVDWNSDGCTCRYLTKLLRAKGHKVEHLDPGRITARHLRREVG